MSKGKKVKPTQPPSFQEPITLKTIGKFIKSRRTQQGLNTLVPFPPINQNTIPPKA